MSLPGGYTQLRYIESNGAQYINTGFNANNNTRVVIDAQATGTSGTLFLFGCREANNSKSFCFFYYQGWSADYETNAQRKTFSNVTYTDRLLVDFNKTNCSVNGASASFSAATFQSPVPLYLFAVNTNGTISGQLSARLYSCKIYDNDTLVRDYVPARSSGGVIGLYDMVSGDFKTNAGTGAFTAGPILTGPVEGNGVSIIDATSHGITEGKTLVDGTGYYIRKGKTLIDGVGYDIAFGVPLGSIAEGSIVYVNENGTPAAFYVAKHDYESGLNGYGRTLLVRKDCYDLRNWGNVPTADRLSWEDSTILSWLNSDYMELLDSKIKNVIGSTNYRYSYVYYNANTDKNLVGTRTRSDAVFLLSMTELGVPTYSDGTTALPIASTLRPAYYNGSTVDQWSRTPTKGVYTNAYIVTKVSNAISSNKRVSDTAGARPALSLPAETMVNQGTYLITG